MNSYYENIINSWKEWARLWLQTMEKAICSGWDFFPSQSEEHGKNYNFYGKMVCIFIIYALLKIIVIRAMAFVFLNWKNEKNGSRF